MSEHTKGIVTYAGVVHPWMCDAMGHLNVRNYVAMFDDASFQLLGKIAAQHPDPDGWADVRMEIDYHAELVAGSLVTVRSWVLGFGTSSVRYRHQLRGSIDRKLHATMQVVTVRFDLEAREKRPLCDTERRNAETLSV